MKRMWSTSLDPMAYAGDEGPRYYNNRMIIDACRPYDRLDDLPARRPQDAGRKPQELRDQLAAALHPRRQSPQGRAERVEGWRA